MFHVQVECKNTGRKTGSNTVLFLACLQCLKSWNYFFHMWMWTLASTVRFHRCSEFLPQRVTISKHITCFIKSEMWLFMKRLLMATFTPSNSWIHSNFMTYRIKKRDHKKKSYRLRYVFNAFVGRVGLQWSIKFITLPFEGLSNRSRCYKNKCSRHVFKRIR